jgi:hypothetical protein
MKRIPVFFAGIFFLQSLFAQVGGTVVSGGGVAVNNFSPPPVHLQDVFSTAVQPKGPSGIEGSPFIMDDWLLANLTLFDGRIADSLYIRLNAFTNKIHFKDEKGEELEARIKIDEIKIIDENPAWHGLIFRTGYSGDMNSFFQVLADGKRIQLLKKIMIVKWETRALGEENRKSFQQEEELYYSANRDLFKGNKRCTYLAEVFETKQEKILDFISVNNIKCNKADDMKRLADFINSL